MSEMADVAIGIAAEVETDRLASNIRVAFGKNPQRVRTEIYAGDNDVLQLILSAAEWLVALKLATLIMETTIQHYYEKILTRMDRYLVKRFKPASEKLSEEELHRRFKALQDIMDELRQRSQSGYQTGATISFPGRGFREFSVLPGSSPEEIAETALGLATIAGVLEDFLSRYEDAIDTRNMGLHALSTDHMEATFDSKDGNTMYKLTVTVAEDGTPTEKIEVSHCY